MRELFLILFLSVQASDVIPVKSLARVDDPLVIPGSSFTALLGVPVPGVRIMAEHAGALIPIPFQIDERTKKGEYLFDMVKVNNAWKPGKKHKTQGVLTKEDSVVLMSEDLGPRIPRKRWPTQRGMEIEAIDPMDGSTGYAYALSFTSPPAASPKRYVRFLPDEKTIVTQYFSLGFKDPIRPAKVNYFAIGNALDGKETPVNILSDFKMKLHMSLLFGKVNIVREESQVSSELVSYTDGPIRTLREIAYTVPLIGKIPSPKMHRLTITYRHGSEYNNVLRIPFKPAILIKGADLLIAWDFTQAIRGSSLFTEETVTPFIFDMATREADLGFPTWAYLKGPFGGFLVRLKFDRTLFADIGKTFLIRQEEDGRGEIGWRVENLEKLKRGRYAFTFRFYGVPSSLKGNEKALLAIEDDPLRITVRQSSPLPPGP